MTKYTNFRDFFSPDPDNESEISPEETKQLNAVLATTPVSDIPVSDRPEVLNYLNTALAVVAMGQLSMDHEVQSKLESLCSELQQLDN